MLQRILHVLLAAAAGAGLLFSSVSTSDFTAHLDRQVHGIHCSFVPGVDAPDVSGSSGCHVTLMSPYSSILRDRVWGGIPVSLPSMAVFAYLLVTALVLLVLRKEGEPRATGYQALAWALPFLTSCVFGYLSLHELGAACKLCIGIYASSAVGFLVALGAFSAARASWRVASSASAATDVEDLGVVETHLDERIVDARADRGLAPTQLERSEFDPAQLEGDADRTIDESAQPSVGVTTAEPPRKRLRLATASEMDRRIRAGAVNRRRTRGDESAPAQTSFGVLGGAFVLGVIFVVVPVAAYASGAPDFERYVGACGTLLHPEDEGRVLVGIGPQTRPVTMLEVLDPLCPSCRGFERRFSQHPAAEQVSRRVLLFPLDDECNWMVDRALHPGACAVSEAVLCAEEDADEVLGWAFDHQEDIRTAAERDPAAARRMVSDRFPSLAQCIGSAGVALHSRA